MPWKESTWIRCAKLPESSLKQASQIRFWSAAGTRPAAGAVSKETTTSIQSACSQLGHDLGVELLATHGIGTGLMPDFDDHFLIFVAGLVTGRPLGDTAGSVSGTPWRHGGPVAPTAGFRPV